MDTYFLGFKATSLTFLSSGICLYLKTLSTIWSQSRNRFGSSCPSNSGISTLKSSQLSSLLLWFLLLQPLEEASLEKAKGSSSFSYSEGAELESSCLLVLLDLLRLLLRSLMSLPSWSWGYFTLPSTFAFSPSACSVIYSRVRLLNMLQVLYDLGLCLGCSGLCLGYSKVIGG